MANTRPRRRDENGVLAPEIIYRRSIVANLYIQGKTQNEIANHLEVTQSTICKDLMRIKDEWKQRMADDFGIKVGEELARIDRLERAAWEGWERSCKDAETKVHKKELAIPRAKDDGKDKKGKGKPSGTQELIPVKILKEKTTRGQSGDPRFLAQIQACIDMRLRIIGAYKVEDPTGKDKATVYMNWDEFYSKMEVKDPVDAAIKALPPAPVITTGETAV